MRTRDVDALLRSLLPALTLGFVACTPTGEPSEGGVPVAPLAEQPASGQGDEGSAQDDAGVEVNKPDMAVAVALPDGPPPDIDRMRRRPACPTQTQCVPLASALQVAANDSRNELGCPTSALSGHSAAPTKTGAPRADPKVPRPYFGGRSATVEFNLPETQTSRAAGEADACCYSWMSQCPGGRPFLDSEAQPLVASLRPGSQWRGGSFSLQGSDEARREAAAQWLADASMEHASVASFARTTLELMALGAPAQLVAQTQQASLDEVEHAKTCMAIAVACGADPVEPGAMKIEGPRAPGFARFAVDTFVEGCIGETTAALAVQRAAAACDNPALRAALEKIAGDEADHAALAWRSVAWALAQGGAPVRVALQKRAARFAASLSAPQARAEPANQAASQQLAKLGRLDAARVRETQRDAWFGIVEPMLARL